MKLIFAINASRKYSVLANQEGITNRLYSYYLLRDMEPNFIRRYIKTGLVDRKVDEFKDVRSVSRRKNFREANDLFKKVKNNGS